MPEIWKGNRPFRWSQLLNTIRLKTNISETVRKMNRNIPEGFVPAVVNGKLETAVRIFRFGRQFGLKWIFVQ